MTERKSYWEHLKDPRWQRMRLEVMERDNWKCCDCGDATTTLNVHHTYYTKGKKPWEYPAESLRTLCEVCHKDISDTLAEIQKLAGTVSPNVAEQILGFVRANALQQTDIPDAMLSIETDNIAYGVAQAMQLTVAEIDEISLGSNRVSIDALIHRNIKWLYRPHLRFKGLRVFLSEDGADVVLDGNEYAIERGTPIVAAHRAALMSLLRAIREDSSG